MAFDPRKQECHGIYLYGAGYHAREDQSKEVLTGQASSFCNECPAERSCWERHRSRTAEVSPEHVERYERERRDAEKRGIGAALFAANKFRERDPDPYFRLSQENFQRGIADRRAEQAVEG